VRIRSAGFEAYIARTGALAVHAYDQPETLLGQGSVGLELEEDAQEIDTLLVAVGGGGLIGGIAAWFESRVRVVAVEPEAAPTLHNALAAGHPVRGWLPITGMSTDAGRLQEFRKLSLNARALATSSRSGSSVAVPNRASTSS
jgi:threonine dehydratase